MDGHEADAGGGLEVKTTRFQIAAEHSAVLISARSTVGPIEFGMTGVEGFVEVGIRDGALELETASMAHLELRVGDLRSGNHLYDAELLRRIDARRFPIATVDLRTAIPAAGDGRYQLEGELTFHGVQRTVTGAVSASLAGPTLMVDGDQAFDMRDFDVPTPTMLMLRIYPDVRVQLHVEAANGAAGGGGIADSKG
jgi:polyisoprenoid-binding protein YceI